MFHYVKEVVKVEASVMRDRVVEEIKLVPDHKLTEIYDLIHYFRVGLQSARNVDQIMGFAGCWKDMPDNVFYEFLQEIAQRRSRAFSRRRSSETSIS